jgi:hypothetical protein
MAKVQFSIQMVRALKGAPLAVLMLLALTGQPQSASWCRRHSGYNDDETITNALLLLADYGLVARNGRYSWQIAANARQLPLMAALLEEDFGAEAETGTPEKPESREGEIVEIGGTPEKPESDSGKTGVPRSSSSRSIDLDSRENLPPLESRAADSGKTGVAAALDAVGIQDPARARLLRLEHVTAGLVRYHAATAANTGQAIYRIEHNWRIKPGWEPPAAGAVPDAPASPAADVPADALALFEQAMAQLQSQVPRADWETWLSGLALIAADGARMVAAVPNRIAAEHVRGIMPALEHELSVLAGRGVRLGLEVS